MQIKYDDKFLSILQNIKTLYNNNAFLPTFTNKNNRVEYYCKMRNVVNDKIHTLYAHVNVCNNGWMVGEWVLDYVT